MQKLETRTLKTANPFLRCQVGFYEVRQTYKPVYCDRYGYKVKEMVPFGEATVFHLLGWGSTVDKARKMAARFTD